MAKAKRVSRDFPRKLLGDAAWTFRPPAYATQAAFETAVRVYSQRVGWDLVWPLEAIVLCCPRVRVHPDFSGDEEAVELHADSPEGFAAGELLFKTHNAVLEHWSDELGDHVFFEGFTLVEKPGQQHNPNEVPLYEICLGS